LVNWQYLLFTETWRHSKFGSSLCKICGEKHYTVFVKVVEGSEIYNFPIHHFVHFYSNFLRKTHSKRGTSTRSRAGRRRAATPRAGARPSTFGPADHFPRPLLPHAAHTPRHLEPRTCCQTAPCRTQRSVGVHLPGAPAEVRCGTPRQHGRHPQHSLTLEAMRPSPAYKGLPLLTRGALPQSSGRCR
jgi:hypothetical protein